MRLAAGLRAFGYGIECGFSLLDLLEWRDRLAGVHRARNKVAADGDELAQQRKIVDLLGQLARGEQALSIGSKAGEIGGATQFAQTVVRLELGFERDWSDDCLAVDQREDAFVDPAMDGGEEMLGCERGREFFENAVVDEHCAQKRGFRLDIGGKRESGIRLAEQNGLGSGHRALVAHCERGGKRTATIRGCG